ncbi:TLC domain-containing protein 5-like [Tubulanus polymorphus]|uniref:TLC domain-containing protein 5-like n=1 Tax=Tubulanus polymorphus TaxID=672921 RepID=UPI003DA631D5
MRVNATSTEAVCGVGCYLFVWSVFYKILRYVSPQRSREWHCRTITMIHAIVVVCLSAWCAFVQGPWPFTDPGGPNTPLQELTIMICLGYFLFDFAWCLLNGTEGALMLVHHVMSIVGLSVILGRGYSGTELTASIFGSEFTNPLLQTRWFLRQSGRRDSLTARVVDVAFMTLFGFLRIGIGSNLLYCYLTHPRPDWIGRSGGISLYVVSWKFWLHILRYAFRKHFTKNMKLPPTRVAAADTCSYSENGCANNSLHQKPFESPVHDTRKRNIASGDADRN